MVLRREGKEERQRKEILRRPALGVLLLQCLGQTSAAAEGSRRGPNSHALWVMLTREWVSDTG